MPTKCQVIVLGLVTNSTAGASVTSSPLTPAHVLLIVVGAALVIGIVAVSLCSYCPEPIRSLIAVSRYSRSKPTVQPDMPNMQMQPRQSAYETFAVNNSTGEAIDAAPIVIEPLPDVQALARQSTIAASPPHSLIAMRPSTPPMNPSTTSLAGSQQWVNFEADVEPPTTVPGHDGMCFLLCKNKPLRDIRRVNDSFPVSQEHTSTVAVVVPMAEREQAARHANDVRQWVSFNDEHDERSPPLGYNLIIISMAHIQIHSRRTPPLLQP